MKVLVEYETPKVNALVIQCPHCGRYFRSKDILFDANGNFVTLRDKDDVDMLLSDFLRKDYSLQCDVCGYFVSGEMVVDIIETDAYDMPKPMEKKIIWE